MAGPAGLYLAILLKKADPAISVTVHERNGPDDAYGFGVVFSDETLDQFPRGRRAVLRRLSAGFRHWGEIAVAHFSVVRSSPVATVSPPPADGVLLGILASRARDLVASSSPLRGRRLAGRGRGCRPDGRGGWRQLDRSAAPWGLLSAPGRPQAPTPTSGSGPTGLRRVQLHLRRHPPRDGVGPRLPVFRRRGARSSSRWHRRTWHRARSRRQRRS